MEASESKVALDVILCGENIRDVIMEVDLWVKRVKTKWTPPAGLFKKSASEIAKGIAAASKDLKQAMARLNFYINRAGKNLSAERKAELEKAKGELRKIYKKAA